VLRRKVQNDRIHPASGQCFDRCAFASEGRDKLHSVKRGNLAGNALLRRPIHGAVQTASDRRSRRHCGFFARCHDIGGMVRATLPRSA